MHILCLVWYDLHTQKEFLNEKSINISNYCLVYGTHRSAKPQYPVR